MSAMIDELLTQAFPLGRAARSPECRNGVRAALLFRLAGERIPVPHAEGTAAVDAWAAGLGEGHETWRRLLAGGG